MLAEPHAVLLPPRTSRATTSKFCNRAKAFVDSGHRILNANKGGEGEGVIEGTARMDLNGTGDGCHHGCGVIFLDFNSVGHLFPSLNLVYLFKSASTWRSHKSSTHFLAFRTRPDV
ncbi:hypothetical protein C8F04DRAFT_1191266 [Mycena alexandri]|uniref:Uncharacterized protein n=1 Tax=Mycena alexandri TaxID=1745969 RepID=A0AAD6WSP5_9AGAR|nr:hypothetical protein C8F04DRAFT_1191266 [Mycena alexandri]